MASIFPNGFYKVFYLRKTNVSVDSKRTILTSSISRAGSRGFITANKAATSAGSPFKSSYLFYFLKPIAIVVEF
jgi:hypothetical protein